METVYNDFEDYLFNYIKLEDATNYVRVELLDRSTRKHQSVYNKTVKSLEEYQEAFDLCRVLTEHYKSKGLRTYVTFNSMSISRDVLNDSLKELSHRLLTTEADFSRKVLSTVESNMVRSQRRQAFLLDIDSKDETILKEVSKRYKNLTNEQPLLCLPTVKGFHVLVKPCRDLFSELPSVELKKNALVMVDYIKQ
jgi:hypothetical protein